MGKILFLIMIELKNQQNTWFLYIAGREQEDDVSVSLLFLFVTDPNNWITNMEKMWKKYTSPSENVSS